MRVLHVSTTDLQGGADKAAFRLSKALGKKVTSIQWVGRKSSQDADVAEVHSRWLDQKAWYLKTRLVAFYKLIHKTENTVIHSPQIFSSRLWKKINHSDFDVVNFHYVQDEMLSISDIGNISKPCIFTLHDMWLFTGAEHYTNDYRYRDGYLSDNRPAGEKGFDINRWCWDRKMKKLKTPHHIVCPSTWMAEKAKESVLLKEWPIEVIPNTLNTDIWKPNSKIDARSILSIPQDDFCIGFGADYSGSDKRKGLDLLEKALLYIAQITKEHRDISLVLFGRMDKEAVERLPFKVHLFGHIRNEQVLRELYNSLDVFVVPSRLDNLPNTVVEAQACGVPIVGFRHSGLQYMISDEIDGKLAMPFDCKDLGECILWTRGRRDYLGANARTRCVENYAEDIVAKKYLGIYEREILLNERIFLR